MKNVIPTTLLLFTPLRPPLSLIASVLPRHRLCPLPPSSSPYPRAASTPVMAACSTSRPLSLRRPHRRHTHPDPRGLPTGDGRPPPLPTLSLLLLAPPSATLAAPRATTGRESGAPHLPQ
jgi:hypothetical protein